MAGLAMRSGQVLGSLPTVGAALGASFDVICAGEALWEIALPGGARLGQAGSPLRARPGGGAVNAALALAQGGLRVGLAAALADDSSGRALVAQVAAAGVDVGGVALMSPRPGLVLVEAAGGARRVVAHRAEDELPVAVPAGWSAPVLLLSGLSPSISHAAALCKAARAARRAGSLVVVDVNARRHAWAGRDPRTLHALLREADVVRCSARDLAGIGADAALLRAAMRPSAVLVLTHGAGAAHGIGPFGEIAEAPRPVAAAHTAGAGDAFTAAICAELARAGDPSAERGDRWATALKRGHEAASARIVPR